MNLIDSEHGEIVRIECGIVPWDNDVTKLIPSDEKRAAKEFLYFFKMPEGRTDFYIELTDAPLDCPFKGQQFGEATVGVCIDCPQRIVEYSDGTTTY